MSKPGEHRSSIRLYVGSYTKASSAGIHVFDVAAADGGLALQSSVDTVEQASYLTPHPHGHTLYVASETVHGRILAFRIADDGSLTEIDRVTSHGSGPCYVSTDADGRQVQVANYVSGTIAAYSLQPDGRFGVEIARFRHLGTGPHSRQDAAHAHCIVASPFGSSCYAADLGTDRIVRYETGDVTSGWSYADETVMRPGAGPRHLVFHPELPVAFVVGELDSTLICLDVDRPSGGLQLRHVVSTLPAGFTGTSIAADVRVHPDGRRVFVSNRGDDSIATFSITDVGRPPELLGHVSSGGRTPRNLALDPTGHTMLVANQDEDTIIAFDLDTDSGVPDERGLAARVPMPVCMAFVVVDR